MAKSIARSVFSDPAFFLAYGFGAGLAPQAPGTVGSVVGMFLFVPMLFLPIGVQLFVVAAALLLGISFTGLVAQQLNTVDPDGIVFDEFVGVWIAMLWLPGWYWLPIAFCLFRLFDILKPWPVSAAERRLAGGAGIMMDDVVAGLLSLGVLQGMHYVYSVVQI